MKIPYRTVIIMIVTLMFSQKIYSDEIHLKNGKIIEAQHCWEDGNTVKYQKYGAEVGIDKKNVKKIVYRTEKEAADRTPAKQKSYKEAIDAKQKLYEANKFTVRYDPMNPDPNLPIPPQDIPIKLAFQFASDLLSDENTRSKLSPEQRQQLEDMVKDSAYLLQKGFDYKSEADSKIYANLIRMDKSLVTPLLMKKNKEDRAKHFKFGGHDFSKEAELFYEIDPNLSHQFLKKSDANELTDEEKFKYINKFKALKEIIKYFRVLPDDYNKVRDSIINKDLYSAKDMQEYKNTFEQNLKIKNAKKEAEKHMPADYKLKLPHN